MWRTIVGVSGCSTRRQVPGEDEGIGQDMIAENQGAGDSALGDPMLTVVRDYEAMSRRGADVVVETITAHPTGAITVPTGSTPAGMYQELVDRIHEGAADFSQVQIFCLDDYLGQTPEDEASLTKLLIQEFLEPGQIPEENVHFIPTTADDPHAAAEQYEQELSSGSIPRGSLVSPCLPTARLGRRGRSGHRAGHSSVTR